LTQGPDPRTPTQTGGVGYASFLMGVGSGSISQYTIGGGGALVPNAAAATVTAGVNPAFIITVR
jgi:hypothetical protein